MPIDGERFRCRSPFLLIDRLTTMHRTVVFSYRFSSVGRVVVSQMHLQYRGRCREWPKTMQRKTEKPHEYSFSEHPCGFMAWSRIRDSNPPPTAWEAVALPDELTLQVLIYISRFCWLCQQVSGRDFRLFEFWGLSAPENRWIYRPEMKKSFSFDGFMVYCAI